MHPGARRCATRRDASRPHNTSKETHVMAVLERSELEASPLADLHAIADQLGLDGFRRLRKAELIEAILRASGDGDGDGAGAGAAPAGQAAREDGDGEADDPAGEQAGLARSRRRGGRGRRLRRGRSDEKPAELEASEPEQRETPARAVGEGRPERQVAEGVVEVLDNGSAFLRVSPPEPS